MRARDLLLKLVDSPDLPLGHRVAKTIQQAIQEGRLVPGTALPGSRVLAEQLGVNRQTVIAVIAELEAEGWLVVMPQRGTFVAQDPPSLKQGIRQTEHLKPQVGFDLPSLLHPISTTSTGALLLADGSADPRLAPAEELARGYQRALRRHAPTLLQDRDPLGTPFLREAIAAWITERQGIHVDPARILLTRGSRGALALVAGGLFLAGEKVVVENPGNRAAWEILQQARLGLRPLPVDAEGLVPSSLAEIVTREEIRLMYLTPRRQFPTGASMGRDRGLDILQLAAKHRIAVIEDDYDGELCFGETRSEPLMALDRTGQVIHIGSLSRLLAPGLRLGYLVLPEPLVPFLARIKRTRGEQGDPAFEWAVADLIRDGDLTRHFRRTRKIYATRRDHLVARLQERLGSVLEVTPPEGGMGLWLRAKPSVNPETWVRAARQVGLILNPPSHFFLEQPQPAFRMGFTQADKPELDQAVARLALALEVKDVRN